MCYLVDHSWVELLGTITSKKSDELLVEAFDKDSLVRLIINKFNLELKLL